MAQINDTFDNKVNDPDYARKLFLIENCIYGVDIQAIAVQISKLRFFISLVVEQKVDKEKDNFGIRPLPNLETKFVAANTLIGIDKPARQAANPKLKELESELKAVRHRLFSAKTPRTKRKLREEDKSIRENIGELLVDDGWGAKTAEQLASWNPYNQNASSEFFDSEWMFGIQEGFDVVIGNPPYIQIQKFSGQQCQQDWEDQDYKTYVKTGDIYSLFYEKGNDFLKQGGHLCYITSNKWMRAKYGQATRKFFLESVTVEQLIDFGDSPIFEAATTYTNILIFKKGNDEIDPKVLDLNSVYKKELFLEDMIKHAIPSVSVFSNDSFLIMPKQLIAIKNQVEAIGTPLKEWDVSINYGIKTGFNEAFIISKEKKDELIAADPKSAEILKPVLRGKDIKRYKAEFADLWLIATFPALNLDIDKYPAVKTYLESFLPKLMQTGEFFTNAKGIRQKTRKKTSNKWFETQDQISYYEYFEKEKIVYPNMTSLLPFMFDELKDAIESIKDLKDHLT